ncbi:MAG TPA: hypothetical protein VFP21_02465, partial [Solirubrobacterales bacterium]|nr:hypothetical protein [Solirubrobacterales bacterium]
VPLLALLGLILFTAPTPVAAAEPEPDFCAGQTLHDYLAPLERMPKLRELPYRGREDFRFRGAHLGASGRSLAVSGGSAGYQLDAPVYRPGDTLFARVENPGAAFVLFGAEFFLEKLEGEGWAPAPAAPGPFPTGLQYVAPGVTSRHCTIFPIPASIPAGRYRLAQEAAISWPSKKGQLRPKLHAEFNVAPS